MRPTSSELAASVSAKFCSWMRTVCVEAPDSVALTVSHSLARKLPTWKTSRVTSVRAGAPPLVTLTTAASLKLVASWMTSPATKRSDSDSCTAVPA